MSCAKCLLWHGSSLIFTVQWKNSKIDSLASICNFFHCDKFFSCCRLKQLLCYFPVLITHYGNYFFIAIGCKHFINGNSEFFVFLFFKRSIILVANCVINMLGKFFPLSKVHRSFTLDIKMSRIAFYHSKKCNGTE